MINNLVHNHRNKLTNSILYSTGGVLLSIPINLYIIDKLLPNPITPFDFNYYKLKMQLFLTNGIVAWSIGFIIGYNVNK